MLQKIDWSECLYLYQVYQSYQAYQLLNQLYFEVLSKLAYKKINKINCAYDFYDFVNLGHPKFIEFINTKSYKNKEFVYRATAYITNFFRNEIRKVSNKTNALNSLKSDQNSVFKDLKVKYCLNKYDQKMKKMKLINKFMNWNLKNTHL